MTQSPLQAGLSSARAQALHAELGPNAITSHHSNPWWRILLRQFVDFMVLILVVAAVVAFLTGESADALVILFIVVLNGLIGFVQEFRTEKTLQALRSMISHTIRVLRDGEVLELDTALLVPGDIVLLGEGDKIPADGILIESHQARVEESALTGESLPIAKSVDDSVFMGTALVHGSARMRVTQIGMQTQFGEIARLTTETDTTKSPLQQELARISLFVAKVTLILTTILFLVGLWRGTSLLESLLFSVSVAIAAVPEGLPTTVTVALALGAATMAKRKAIMKRLSSVETLGAVTTICSDKTGTLTQNQMTVREVYLADRSVYQVTGSGYDPDRGSITYTGGGSQSNGNETLLRSLYQVCALCNDAQLSHVSGQYTILGDPTEGALLTLAQKASFTSQSEVHERFPFDSDRKRMSVVTDAKVLAKGSPESILDACTHYSDGHSTHTLTDEKRAHIIAHYTRMAERALRVLAFAEKSVTNTPTTQDEAESNLTFLGLVGMMDPPRSEVKDAVAACHTAGIRIIIITGDYGLTAHAIAAELGIKHTQAHVYTGPQLQAMSDADLSALLADTHQSYIFARTQPAQKRRIVTLLQAQDEVVAMTGDGVNDAPALKKADIGVAMGITGTEVSQEAASMILTNDSFGSIVNAVEEGRRIYANLKKFLWFIFACNIGELVTIFAALLFGFASPLTAVLILAIDLGTDILPAVALGIDPAEKGIMHHPPRPKHQRVMTRPFVLSFLTTGAIIGACVVGAFLWGLWGQGYSLIHAQTLAFASLVCVQLLNTFSARSFTTSAFRISPFNNTLLLIAIFTSILLVLLMVYMPFLQGALKTTALTPTDWLVVLTATVIPFVFLELKKAFTPPS